MPEKATRRRAAPAVRLADVARAAGVGESTASRVVRKQGSIAAETRARVQAALDHLGYVPNRIAGTLASRGSRLVGVVVPSLENIVFPDLLRGANAALEAAGFQSVIGVTDYDEAREEALIRSLLAWRPAGLLIAGLEHSTGAVAMMRASGIRIAELLDTDGDGIDIVVGFSNRAAGRASAEHLVSRGYRTIGYVGHDLRRDRRAAKRFAGFTDALAGAGCALVDREIVEAASSVAAGRDALQRLLARSPRLDAVYFSNDDMALGGYFLCLAQGIAMPERLALLGYNGLDVVRLTPQPISTLRTPRVAVGETGARLICAAAPPTRVDLGFELIQGATT